MSLSKLPSLDLDTAKNGFTFPLKVKSFPVVESTCYWLSESYNRLKESSYVTKQTCCLAESTLKSSLDYATPLLTKFRPQVDVLDSMACTQLDRLETAFPIIKSNTDTLVTQGKELISTWTVQPAVNKFNNIKTCTENKCEMVKNIYHKSCEYSDLRAQTKLLANKILQLTENLIEKNLIDNELKKDSDYMEIENEYLRWYLNYKQANNDTTSNMSIGERTKVLSLVFYFFVQDKLIRQLSDSIRQIKDMFSNLHKLIDMYDMFKRNVSFRLQDKFHVTRDKIDVYKEYLDVLSRQFTVQDGRSLEHVHSLEERTKILIRRSIGNLLTAFHLVYSKLEQLKPIMENNRLNSMMKNLIADIYQLLNKDENSFNEVLVRNFLNEYSDLVSRLDTLVGAIKNYNASIVSWCVPNFEAFGIIDFGENEEDDMGEERKEEKIVRFSGANSVDSSCKPPKSSSLFTGSSSLSTYSSSQSFSTSTYNTDTSNSSLNFYPHYTNNSSNFPGNDYTSSFNSSL